MMISEVQSALIVEFILLCKFLSSKNRSQFPKRKKRMSVSRGAVFIVFAV